MMRIPLTDLKLQYRQLKSEIDATLIQLMEDSDFVRGPKVEAFEKAFSDYHGKISCVSLNSGTDALFFAFKAMRVKPGDEIITVPFTFIATVEAIENAGASAKFVDVDPERYTLDPSKLEKAITPKTVGIVPVHLYGMPADMAPILQIARKHGLWVVEDACQAHGATYGGKKVGTLGNAAAFSFYPSKNLGAFGDAGALVTADSKIAEEVRMLKDHGQITKDRSERVGFNSRMDAFQAAVLLIKLKHLDDWNQKRRRAASWYDEGLKGIKAIQAPKRFEGSQPVYHLYVVLASTRDKLASFLKENGISTAVHYVLPVHHQTPFRNLARPDEYPVCDNLSGRILSLPMYPDITREEVSHVIEKVREFYS